ncbi:hypothetical protein PR048_003600, partial [Dryococelus australis]
MVLLGREVLHTLFSFWVVDVGLSRLSEQNAKIHDIRREDYEALLHTCKKISDKHMSGIVICRSVTHNNKENFISANLFLVYGGPFKVKIFLTPVTVSLEDPSNGFVVKKAHVSALKLYTAQISKMQENVM